MDVVGDCRHGVLLIAQTRIFMGSRTTNCTVRVPHAASTGLPLTKLPRWTGMSLSAICTVHYVSMAVKSPGNIASLRSPGEWNVERCVLYAQSDRLVLILTLAIRFVFVLPPDHCILAIKTASCANSSVCEAPQDPSVIIPPTRHRHAKSNARTGIPIRAHGDA